MSEEILGGSEPQDIIPEAAQFQEEKAPDPAPEAAPAKKSIVLNDWFIMLALYVVTVILHILMTQVTSMFNLTPDEYAVTAVAAWFNGYDWSPTVSAGGYYGYFQSLLYIPIFKIFSDPWTQYRAMIIENGIIMGFVPVIAYFLSRRWFDVRKLSSTFIAVICGLYPCYMLLTKYTWNETMCCVLPWVFALLMYKSLKSHKDTSRSAKAVLMQQLWAVLAGLTLIASYATHGRMLALVAAGAVLELVVLISMRRRLFSLIGFYGSLVLGFFGDRALKKFFQSVLWLKDGTGKASVNTIENMFGRLSGLDSEKLMHFPQTLAGHFFYFISSTWGFGAICIVLIISGIVMYYVSRNRAKKGITAEVTDTGKTKTYISSNLAIFCWYALLAMGAIFVVSVSFKATSTVYDTRADTTIFGRYIETFFPIAIFPALIMIYRKRFSAAHCIASLFTAAGIFLLTELFTVPVVIGDGETTKSIVGAMILGIGPLRIGEGLKDPFTEQTFIKITAVVTVLLVAVLIVRLVKKNGESIFNWVAIPLTALLMYSTLYCFDGYTIVQGKNAQYGADYVSEALDMIKDCEYNDVTAFSMKQERYVKAQFLYPDMTIRVASSMKKLSSLEKRPDFIISDREDNLNIWINDIYLVGDINHNVHLYACSDNAKEWCREQGLTLTEPGSVEYTGENIPSTSSVERSTDGALLPEGSAVYTNYFVLYASGNYTATIRGEDVDRLSIALTSDKKANKINYEVISSDNGETVISFSVSKAKTENVQLKLTNKSGPAVTVTGLSIERENKAPLATLPGVAGLTVKIS